jgi:ceramide glucosyltransferase
LPQKTYFIFAALLLLQSAASLRDGFRFLRFTRASLRRKPGSYAPPAAVVIPAKGLDPGFAINVSQYLTQDYLYYQLVFVVASEQDPAFSSLHGLLTEFERSSNGKVKVSLQVAGYSDVRGEKVNNLLTGVAAVAPEAEVMVFADADAQPARDWLRSLVAPLEDPHVTVSTGFRWYLPGEDFVSLLRAAWDTSIATLLGDHRQNFAWGGAMAIRTTDFERLQIAERYWARTVSDDYALTRAVRDARGTIRFEPRCLMASREDSTFGDFVRWANRQIILTRVYAAPLWRLGLAAHLLYCGTIFAGLVFITAPATAANNRLVIAGILAGILLLGLAKGRIRTIVARELFPAERQVLQRRGSCYWLLAPIVPWVMLFNFLVAGFTRRIEWRGTEYELVSPDQVRVLGRKQP